MDAARTRLIGTLEWLATELAAGGSLAQCLRRLPKADYQCLCAPLPVTSVWCWPWRGAGPRADEPLVLARIALAAGVDAPAELAAGLAQLATDLRESAP